MATFAQRKRQKPGAGQGEYFRVEVRPQEKFVTFRTHDVGRPGHTKRLAGKRSSGSWDTKSWLIKKSDAHVEGNTLVIDEPVTKKVLKALSSKIRHVKGDVFEARVKRNVPESEKPTPAQIRARRQNIQKALRARKNIHSYT